MSTQEGGQERERVEKRAGGWMGRRADCHANKRTSECAIGGRYGGPAGRWVGRREERRVGGQVGEWVSRRANVWVDGLACGRPSERAGWRMGEQVGLAR